MTVADVYDALTHERPYRAAWSEEEAMAEMKALSGRLFDPEVIEKLVKRLALSGKDGNRRPLISVHYDELKVGMTLAGELRTTDGRFVLAGDTVLNKNLVDGILRLAAGKAIEEEIQIFESA